MARNTPHANAFAKLRHVFIPRDKCNDFGFIFRGFVAPQLLSSSIVYKNQYEIYISGIWIMFCLNFKNSRKLRYLSNKQLSIEMLTCSSPVSLDLDHTTIIGNIAVQAVKRKLTIRKII
jgi:hypothetical protein